MKYPAPFVYVSIYDAWVIFCLNWDNNKLNKLANKQWDVYLDESHGGGKCHHLTKATKTICIIHMPLFKKNKPSHLSVLSHECLHAAMMILGDIGQKVDSDNHECLTYLHQYIFQAALEK